MSWEGLAGFSTINNTETPGLQACANAEAAYTRTLTAASKVKLVGDCDGASVRGALDGFSDLPFMVGQVIGYTSHLGTLHVYKLQLNTSQSGALWCRHLGDAKSAGLYLIGLSSQRISQAHASIGAGLSDTTKSMQDVVSALRAACTEIGGESTKVHKAIDSCRRGLHSAFTDHQSACR